MSQPREMSRAVSVDKAATLLRAVLIDNENLARRLEMIADEFNDLDHADRMHIGARFPGLTDQLLRVEEYHKTRRGVV